MPHPLTFQDALLALQRFWTERGCMLAQPYHTEVGAGTMNPATILRVLGPEPWRVAYVEPSIRPDDSRYGENPNRLATHTQFQVVLKPDPGNPQELYLESLQALGIDLRAHDVRFVEDNWAQPAIGAWGLGWEVWLDGLEITQFTYFQQVGGQDLDPVSVELTYGMERIMMALQGVTHFRAMEYAPGISYGEVFGQGEYEMSRYYLDDADVPTNRQLFDRYTAEAQRMIEARLPVPAHDYVLKSSHAFNVLDARGAISTTERATAFGIMRGLSREVSRLWVQRRAELGFPLLTGKPPPRLGHAVMPPTAGLAQQDTGYAAHPGELAGAAPRLLAIEIGVEELPPHVVEGAIDQVRTGLLDGLGASRLGHGPVTVTGTPRRIVALVPDVAAGEADAEVLRKGPRVAAAYDSDGSPTAAARGFARGQRVDVSALVEADFDGARHVAVAVTRPGRDVFEVVGGVIAAVVSGLRADRNMRWSDPELAYSRPIRWILALWGESVVPVQVSGLRSGRTTYADRTAAAPLVEVENAEVLEPKLAERDIMLDPVARRAAVVEQAGALAARVGGIVDVAAEAELVDEVTNLVESPHGILGSFEPRYLELPEPVLTTVMRSHQRYLPVRAPDGSLLAHFVTMAGGACDEDLVRAGNENVLRARYEDAAFFFAADLKVPPEQLRARLEGLTFEDRLGSMSQRSDRIGDVASRLGEGVDLDPGEAATLARAGALAKFDLASQLVVELPSLAGTMAREYAIRAGEPAPVAAALLELEQPRSSGDRLPTSRPGALLALADRFDLLMAMFSLGATPTGSSDPFALRRAALGVVAILRAQPTLAGISVRHGLTAAADRLREQGVEVTAEALASAADFVVGRFGQQLHDEGVPAALVAAVGPLAGSPGRAEAALHDLEAVRGRDGFARLVQATQRITRLVPEASPAAYRPEVLQEAAELALHAEVASLPDLSGARLPDWAAAATPLVPALERFFDEVLVMAEDPALRAARLGLLQTIVRRAPKGIDWRALHTALDS